MRIAFTLPVTLTTVGTLSVALRIPHIPKVRARACRCRPRPSSSIPAGSAFFAAPGPFVPSQAYTILF